MLLYISLTTGTAQLDFSMYKKAVKSVLKQSGKHPKDCCNKMGKKIPSQTVQCLRPVNRAEINSS